MNEPRDRWSLGSLLDPGSHQEPIYVPPERREEAHGLLELMVLIRSVETRIAEGRRDGVIGGPVHLAIGQEGAAVGVAKHLQSSDHVFGAHRSHAQALAMGASVRGLFAEVRGRATGLSRGMGGSMHLWAGSVGFSGSVPIVAGTVPLAVGAGLAAKLRARGEVAVAFLGDGAVEEGVFHESLNLARMTNSATLFVVEHNSFSSHLHVSLRQPFEATSRFAEANGVPWRIVDGNNVLEVADAAGELIGSVRRGHGPAFLEAVTFRWRGHVDWREDLDVGVRRSADEVREWKRRDPIARLARGLSPDGEDLLASLTSQADVAVESLWFEVENDPYPDPSSILCRVFAEARMET